MRAYRLRIVWYVTTKNLEWNCNLEIIELICVLFSFSFKYNIINYHNYIHNEQPTCLQYDTTDNIISAFNKPNMRKYLILYSRFY